MILPAWINVCILSDTKLQRSCRTHLNQFDQLSVRSSSQSAVCVVSWVWCRWSSDSSDQTVVCLSQGEAHSGMVLVHPAILCLCVCVWRVCVCWFDAQQDRAFMLCVSYLAWSWALSCVCVLKPLKHPHTNTGTRVTGLCCCCATDQYLCRWLWIEFFSNMLKLETIVSKC